jgi:hypothetical protein
MDRNSNEMRLVAYNFEPEYSEEEMTSRSQHSITEASSADGKWQPAWLAGNLKLIRYKRALTSALVKFSLKTSYFHFFISQLVSFSFN